MYKEIFINPREMEEIAQEFEKRRKLVDELKRKISRAQKLDSVQNQAYYEQIIKSCDSFFSFYETLGKTSREIAVEAETLLIEYKAALEEAIELSEKIQ